LGRRSIRSTESMCVGVWGCGGGGGGGFGRRSGTIRGVGVQFVVSILFESVCLCVCVCRREGGACVQVQGVGSLRGMG